MYMFGMYTYTHVQHILMLIFSFLVNSWKYLRNIQIFTQFPTSQNQTKTGHNQLGKFFFLFFSSFYLFFFGTHSNTPINPKSVFNDTLYQWWPLFPSAPAQILSPRAPPNHHIQRAALTTALMMMTRRNIDASWLTKPAEAFTIPRNTTTLNCNSQCPVNLMGCTESQLNKPSLFIVSDLCWDISCACHCPQTISWSHRQQMGCCSPHTYTQYKCAIYKTASFYTCNVFIWNFTVYFMSARSDFIFPPQNILYIF